MKKRVLSLLLVGMMATGLLVGCGEQEGEVKKESTQTGSTQKENSEKADEEAEAELTTVKILAPSPKTADQMADWDWTAVAPAQKLVADLDEIGLRLEVEFIEKDAYANVINTRMATGQEMPDLIGNVNAASISELQLVEWGRNGQIYELQGLMDQYDEDGSIVKFYQERLGNALQLSLDSEGKMYWFASVNNSFNREDEYGAYKNTNVIGTLVQREWMEALGEEVQVTYSRDEIVDLAKRMQDEDVNGNGAKDETIHVDITTFNNMFAKSYGLFSRRVLGGYKDDGIVVSNFEHENFEEYIKFMQKLYKDGLYDTDCLSTSRDDMLAANRVTMFWAGTEWTGYVNFMELAEDKAYYLPTEIDDDGDISNGFPALASNGGTSTVMTNRFIIPTSNKNPEPVIRLMDYIYTDEYALLSRFGLEGQAYEKDENGNIKALPYLTPDTSPLYYDGFAHNAIPLVECHSLYQSVNFEGAKKIAEESWWAAYKYRRELLPVLVENGCVERDGGSLPLYSDEEAEFMNAKSATLETYASELLVDLILGNKSLDDMPEYLDEMNELGLQEYLDILQAQLDRS